jgi:FkbM family methyltransferase
MIAETIRDLGERILRRQSTLRFLARKSLVRIPYVPVLIRIDLTPEPGLNIWWSYVSETDIPGLPLREYWSNDAEDLRFLSGFLKPGMTFFDVGAYHGIYSIVAAKRVGPHGRVVAFEPSARERRRLRLHARMNRVWVEVEPYAISAQMGSCPFFTVLAGLTSMNSLVPPPIKDPVRRTPVEAISLDQYLAAGRVGKVDVLKIDIEGGELEAFRGARATLEVARPPIICEVLDWVTAPWGYPANDIMTFLREFDYQWFEFRDGGTLTAHVEREHYPEIRNYLAVPQEKLSLIEPWWRT